MLVRSYLIALPIFLGADMLWIRVLAQNFYQEQIGFLLAPQANVPAAIAFYLLYLSGLAYFAIVPAVEARSAKAALFRGGVYGLMTYGTYDLTNLATTKGWPLPVTLVDLAWGTFLCGIVASATWRIVSKISNGSSRA